jgi:hypothetical protein
MTNTDTIIDEEDEQTEQDEEITPAELIEKLEQVTIALACKFNLLNLTINKKKYLFCKAWLNEKFAPELLEHKTGIVECIIEQINHMENNIKTAKKGDFRIAIHKLEIDRIKFILHSYLRIRINKVHIKKLWN